jgi:hypothetical protein
MALTKLRGEFNFAADQPGHYASVMVIIRSIHHPVSRMFPIEHKDSPLLSRQ